MELPQLTQRYLRLRHATDIGLPDLGRALRQHGTLSALLIAESTNTALHQALDNPDQQTRYAVDQELKWQDIAGHELVVYESPAYPALLREIADPPPVLAVRGNLDLLQQAQLAGVGSRQCSQYGSNIARWLAHELSACGLIMTSGMARGIDAAIHQGALEQGPTIAVIATGQDRVYPGSHRRLADQIAERGAIVSEFALGSAPLRGHFPRRNRIISGMSLGVLVVEAGLKSGSLITAKLAMDQDREVFAVPGNINLGNARGCHWLLRSGASLVESAGDVLQELPDSVLAELRRRRVNDNTALPSSAPVRTMRDPGCRAILKALRGESMLVDELLQHSGLGIDVLHASLLLLEMQGITRTQAGRVFMVNH